MTETSGVKRKRIEWVETEVDSRKVHTDWKFCYKSIQEEGEETIYSCAYGGDACLAQLKLKKLKSGKEIYFGNNIPHLDHSTEQTNSVNKMATLGELKIQNPAPHFAGTAVVDGQFKEISLSDYKGKYLVFFFYPLDFTFVCPTEIIAFSDRVDEFRKIDCEIVAASTDSHFSHLAWVNTPRKQGGLGKMDIPLLADKTGDIAKAYGVYKEDDGIAYRGLFIIDNKQNLRQITINDLPVGRSVDETLRLVQAFQFTDKYGEVCPAGWKPGQKTIKPSVEKSKEFFQEQ